MGYSTSYDNVRLVSGPNKDVVRDMVFSGSSSLLSFQGMYVDRDDNPITGDIFTFEVKINRIEFEDFGDGFQGFSFEGRDPKKKDWESKFEGSVYFGEQFGGQTTHTTTERG
ncbi:MAG: hypothetical protein UU48_C0002G0005 [Candidatus Uhrbacteria bacterium GW2011_GWF2_41_16]|uniref:Uncharacterized protein n=2 Tax=Candidatus Uhriibacteriota TaxID=1752732 RepID=A0A0G0XNT7_9BACT|nr:MAG: hypothetical protein UU31_C0003G0013 [Candidatus Uhrbacteria bacterium GW2011_GWA2_41_10]KKR87286.1 MAG: hypothetical protein UU35_C0004G0059 [Candidatus Uhrbacteria bacterium GW2011_GWC2_41_11]KKR98470.1 MAG: hypothetical protein UU48_C0002G0005 [Candidatus Uhrbacteria bacterium GW2011_GWF2_41_16]